MTSEPITSTTVTLTPEQADLLRGEHGGTIIAEIKGRTAEEMWRRIEDALLHGTTEQRRARTREQVRANLRERD